MPEDIGSEIVRLLRERLPFEIELRRIDSRLAELEKRAVEDVRIQFRKKRQLYDSSADSVETRLMRFGGVEYDANGGETMRLNSISSDESPSRDLHG